MKLPLLLTLLATSCTTPLTYDQEVQQYQDEYIARLKHPAPILVPIRFVDSLKPLDNGIYPAAICTIYPLAQAKVIEIDRTYYKELISIERKALIFHELSHCIMFEEHDETLLDDGCPATLMHPIIPTLECLDRHWPMYENKLFQDNNPFYSGGML